MRPHSFSLAFFLLFAIFVVAGNAQRESDEGTQARVASQRLVSGHIAWKTRMSNEGASIQVKEIERRGSQVHYQLYVSGLPTDQLYNVISWPVTQTSPSNVIQGASLGDGGIVMCAGRTAKECGDSSQKDDPIDFAFDAAKAEPYRLALVAGSFKVATVIVPDPIIGKDKNCTITVERLLPHFELAYVSGQGFPPNVEVSFDTQSHGEGHLVKTAVDGQGNLQFALMPFVSGHSKGSTTVKAMGTTCSPSIEFDWGK